MNKSDGVDVLSKVSGLPRTEILGLLEHVKANSARLASCSRHNFEPAVVGSRKRKCLACGGEAGALEANWYERGLRHGAVP